MTSEYMQDSLGPRASLENIQRGNLHLLNRENVGYFETGYESADAVFDPTRSTLENVAAALHAQRGHDQLAPNQGGFVLGVLARVEELSRGQQQ